MSRTRAARGVVQGPGGPDSCRVAVPCRQGGGGGVVTWCRPDPGWGRGWLWPRGSYSAWHSPNPSCCSDLAQARLALDPYPRSRTLPATLSTVRPGRKGSNRNTAERGNGYSKGLEPSLPGCLGSSQLAQDLGAQRSKGGKSQPRPLGPFPGDPASPGIQAPIALGGKKLRNRHPHRSPPHLHRELGGETP